MLAMLIAIACQASVDPFVRPRGPAEPPNVLVIVTDDQRARQTLAVMPRTRRYFRKGGTECRGLLPLSGLDLHRDVHA
jgi:hypothetical protein